MGLWDKIKDYVGIGLNKAEDVGKALKKAGREPQTNLQDAVADGSGNLSGRKKAKKKSK